MLSLSSTGRRASAPCLSKGRQVRVPSTELSPPEASEAPEENLFPISKAAAVSIVLVASVVPGARASQPTRVETLEALQTSIREQWGKRFARKMGKKLEGLQQRGLLEQRDSQDVALLARLGRFVGQEMAQGVDHKKAFRLLLEQLENPENMTQGGRGTCAPAGVQHLLARRYPAEYARLVSGLLSPTGEVETHSGAILVREPGILKKDDSQRDLLSRVLQSSFVEYGNGSENYDNGKDLSLGVQDDIEHLHEANPWVADSGHQANHNGMFPNEVARLAEAVFPGQARTAFTDPQRSEQHLLEIEHHLARGREVFVALKWEQGTHLLPILASQGDHYLLWNPQGERPDVPSMEMEPGFGFGFDPIMVDTPVRTRRAGPEREVWSKEGRIRLPSERVAELLQNYVVSGLE